MNWNPKDDPPPGKFLRLVRWIQRAELARLREKCAPLAWGIATAAFGFSAGLSHYKVNAIVAGVLPVAITVAAVLAGFQSTAHSLMFVLIETPVVRSLRVSGHYDRLVAYFKESSRSLSWFIALAVVAMILQACRITLPWHDRVVPAALSFLFVWAFAANCRVNRLMVKLLLRAGKN